MSFVCFPIPSLRSPILLLIFPCVLAAGIYRERLRKEYNADVCRFGSLAYVSITAADFDSGLFDCFKGPNAFGASIFNCLCCPVRIATNASATGCNDFWWTVIMATFVFPFIPIIGYILRMHVRDLYDMDRHPVADFFAWLCCYCCALTQEAKFLNHGFEAIRRGTAVVFVQSRRPPRPPPDEGLHRPQIQPV